MCSQKHHYDLHNSFSDEWNIVFCRLHSIYFIYIRLLKINIYIYSKQMWYNNAVEVARLETTKQKKKKKERTTTILHIICNATCAICCSSEFTRNPDLLCLKRTKL